MAEHVAHNDLVTGSNPVRPTKGLSNDLLENADIPTYKRFVRRVEYLHGYCSS